MPFAPFHQYFLELAEKETRVITIYSHINEELPAGEYVFQEMYCNEPDCDCRRVFFHVTSTNHSKPDAVIAYGWESLSFYAKWMNDNDPQLIAELKGPCLNLCSPQSRLAPALLRLTEDVLLQDPGYIIRIKRHYQMFREKFDRTKRYKKRMKRIVPKSLGFGN